MKVDEIYTVLKTAKDAGWLKVDEAALLDALLNERGFFEVYEQKEKDATLWALATMVNVTMDGVKRSAYTKHKIDMVECTLSSSGNITWKAYALDGAVIYLRQKDKDKYIQHGIWSELNKIEVGGKSSVADAWLHTSPDGSFRKVERVEGGWGFIHQVPEQALVDVMLNGADAVERPKRQAEVIQWAKGLVDAGDFVVIDTETTGLHNAYPVQVAVLAADGTVLFDELIKLPEGVRIDPGAARVHGITTEKLEHAPTWDKVAARFWKVVDDKRVVIYNAAYDVPVIQRIQNAYPNVPRPEDLRVAECECAMEMFAQWAGDWNDHHGNYRWVKLTDAAKSEGVPVQDAHSALGDCRMTLGLIKALAAKAETIS